MYYEFPAPRLFTARGVGRGGSALEKKGEGEGALSWDGVVVLTINRGLVVSRKSENYFSPNFKNGNVT